MKSYERRAKAVSVTLDAEDIPAYLELMRAERHRSFSALVRTALDERLEKFQQKEAAPNES